MAVSAPVSVPVDQRFAQLIQQFGLTKNSFAMSLGKTASVVQHLIDGRNKPGFDLLCKVFEIYPNVSRDWLLLGRGPMLVSGEPAPKPVAAAPAVAITPPEEDPLEPIDISDIEAPGPRRTSARLQPEEIMATLALAAAATQQPARTHGAAPQPDASAAAVPAAAAPAAAAVAPETPPTPSAPVAAAPVVPPVAAAPAPAEPAPAPAAAIPAPTAAPAPELVAPAPAPAPAAPAPPAPSPDAYIAAALHAQHLQHQLALAEIRNQHLQEQQNMLREMLAMARQSMV